MATDSASESQIPWYKSLIVRVVVLCVVLVICLFAVVAGITRHFFSVAIHEMEDNAKTVADNIVLQLNETPNIDMGDLEHNMMAVHPGFDVIHVTPQADPGETSSVTVASGAGNKLTRVAHVPIVLEDDRRFLLTIQLSTPLQTEVIRAFSQKYLAAVIGAFILALGLMIFSILRALRPLADLSQSCAEIGSGHLQDVTVRRTTGEIRALEQTFNRMVASLREKEIVEAKLRQAQRASALGTLAAGVAHDVRNPLNTIKLLASHALDKTGDAPENATIARQLNTIRSEVNRIEEIVSGFLSLAKERQLQIESNRLDALLEQCLRLVSKDAETRGIAMTSELRCGEISLLLDPKQFTRAILNILLNAFDACPRGGRVRLFSRATEDACQIEIRDDGPGMPPEVAEHAFDPYFTTKDTGTGLGLSTTRGIIEEHGGTISLSSEPGIGCQVLITLPRKLR